MNYEMSSNPLQNVRVDFPAYVNKRKAIERGRMGGNGLPNYAYDSDYEHRKKLDAIPGLYKLAKLVCSTTASRYMQKYNIYSVLVGPDQFPDVYEIGCDCARRLGIGVPNIYIVNDQTMNAFTIAMDDIDPIIVIHSGLYERLTPGELRAVIGHECGHIQNHHGVYDMLVVELLNRGMNGLSTFVPVEALLALTAGAQVALYAWSRAAEITSDRAGMICSERLEDNYSAQAKLMYGGAFGDHEINYEALRRQLDMQQGNIARYDEIFNSHPSGARRIAAEMEFAKCDVLYDWRPELKEPGMTLRSKKQTDEVCHRFVDVSKKR